MSKFLSHITTPTALLYIFLVVTHLLAGIYISSNIELPPAYTFLYPIALLWIIGWWLEKDSRKHGVKWVFDMGLFLYLAWPLIMPFYLFKTRGVKAFLTIIAFVAVYLGAYVLGVAIYVLLTP